MLGIFRTVPCATYDRVTVTVTVIVTVFADTIATKIVTVIGRTPCIDAVN